MSRVGVGGVLMLVGTAACARADRVHVEQFSGEPALRETVLSRSAPLPPDWIEPRQKRGPDGVVFVGEGTAADVAGARAAARSNLFSTISMFVSVDVSSELEDFASSDGTNEVRMKTETKSDTSLEGVAPDAAYWEQILVSPILPNDARYRVLLRAHVPREEIGRARIRAQARRAKDTGQPSLAVLPFDLAIGEDTALAPALWEELTARLGDANRWRVAEPSLVRAVFPPGVEEGSARQRVQDALLPDLILSGTTQRSGDHVRLTVTVHDGRNGDPLVTEVATAKLDGATQMIADLAARIGGSRALTAGAGSSAAPADAPASPEPVADDLLGGGEWFVNPILPFEALRHWAKAYEHYARGALEEAGAEVRLGIDIAPDDPRGWMRLGRILERRGHFGRLPSQAASARAAAPVPVACTDKGRAAIREAKERIAKRASAYAGSTSETRVWWTASTAGIDDVLANANALLLAASPGGACGTCGSDRVCDPLSRVCMVSCKVVNWCGTRETCGDDGICRCTQAGCRGELGRRPTKDVDSAAEAYLVALTRAQKRRSTKREVAAGLALADLAVRVDRFDEADDMYRRVRSWALAKRDLNALSLAAYGRGVLLRQRGQFESARVSLIEALRARGKLGEKPYLLEIYNELGTVSVELGRPGEARRFFARALTLARDLDQPYVKAILDNNVGVLETSGGEVAVARERFDRAFRTLADLGDSEGRLSAALNLGFVATLRGDPIEADTKLGDAEQLVEKSGQEGRRAQWLAQRGATAVLSGRANKALVDIAESGLVASRLGRNVEAQRRISDFVVAEQRVAPTQEVIECHARWFASQGTPVFEPRKKNQRVDTVADIEPGSMQVHDLVAALNAAVLAAQTAWRPALVRYAAPAAQPYVAPRARDAFPAFQQLHGMLTDPRSPPVVQPQLQPGPGRRWCGDPTAQVAQLIRHARDIYLLRPTVVANEIERLLQRAQVVVQQRCYELEVRPDLDRSRKPGLPVPSEAPTSAKQPEAQRRVFDEVVVVGKTAAKREAEAPPPDAKFKKRPEYERLLGAATVAPDLVLLLDPATLKAHRAWRPRAKSARRMVRALVAHFEHAGTVRYEAAARLNLGALLWFEWRPQDAYEQLMTAREIYARMGDAEGLARTYEWLGYALQDSLEPERAARHFAFSKHLYERQDDVASAERILSYTD